MGLLPVADALERILAGAAATGAEAVPLLESRGRILARDVAARLTLPPFDNSAMDGYAVRAADVTTLPARLKLAGESAAGRRYAGVLQSGEAVRIFTGAPLPEGADAVVIQESTTAEGSTVVVTEGVAGNIRRTGGDFRSGDVLLRAGGKIDARSIAVAAAMGHATLEVRRRPDIAILATGDELVPPGTTPDRDQIVSSNPYGIAAMVEAAGGRPRLLGIARDERADLDAKIAAAAGADVLVTIGGASVGDYDIVMTVLKERGFLPDFWKIAMRPGKPLLFGLLGPQRVIGLPGNPVSALICARVFLVPLIRRLLGLPDPPERSETATLAAPVEANGPRRHYMRARLDDSGATLTVTPAPSQDSSLLSHLVASNCLIVREAGAKASPSGTPVPILRLDF